VNKILFMWLKYLSSVNKGLEEYNISIKQAVDKKDSEAFEEIHPISIFIKYSNFLKILDQYEKAVENKLKRGKIDFLYEYEDLKFPEKFNRENN